MGQALRVPEGPLAPVACVSVTAYQKCEKCVDEAVCGIRLVMMDVQEAVADILDSTSLEQVIERSRQAAQQDRNAIDYGI